MNSLAQYPHIWPPPGFITLNRSNSASIAAAVKGQIFDLENIQLPMGYVGWIRRMGLEASDWSLISFRFVINEMPLRDFTSILVPIGSPSTPEDVYINIPQNQIVKLQAVALDIIGEATPLRWYLGGWYYQQGV